MIEKGQGDIREMKRTTILFLLFIITVLSACSEQKESSSRDLTPQFLDVQVTIKPEQGKINEPVIIEAKLTYGDKKVTNPDEIEYEVWRSQSEKHEKIKPKHVGDGVFQIEKTFTEEGTYYVYVHVTAENMHNMPKKEFTIGQASEPESESNSSIMEQ